MTLLRSLRPNFVFHPIFTDFHLEFPFFLVSGSFDLDNPDNLILGGKGIFSKNTFLKSVYSNKKDELCSVSSSFSLYHSVEEVCLEELTNF